MPSKYPLVLRSGHWVPDYDNYVKKDKSTPYVVSRLHDDWVEIPIDHPDYVALSERRQFQVMRQMAKNWRNYSYTFTCSVSPVIKQVP